jgi:hypothetical protein
MYAMASPLGDQTGAHDFSSLVSRKTSVPVFPSRIAMSVPRLLVLVTAI